MSFLFNRLPIALFFLAVLAVVSAVFVFALKPTAVVLAVYKLHVLTAAALVAWWLDHVLLFPYARPAGYLAVNDWRDGPVTSRFGFPDFPVHSDYALLFAVACLRRALIVGFTVLAAAMVL